MRRRDFITLLGGVAVAWPLAARAQQPTKMLRVGTVAGTPKSSPQWVAFERRMGELGYQEGKNFSFDFLDYDRAFPSVLRTRDVVTLADERNV
jgi:putative ABC transport system substrate-binding protein